MRALRMALMTAGLIGVLGGTAAQARTYTLDLGVRGQATTPAGIRLFIDAPITAPGSPTPRLAEFLSDRRCLPEERCTLRFPGLRLGIPSYGALRAVYPHGRVTQMAGTAYDSPSSDGAFAGRYGPGTCFGSCPPIPSP